MRLEEKYSEIVKSNIFFKQYSFFWI